MAPRGTKKKTIKEENHIEIKNIEEVVVEKPVVDIKSESVQKEEKNEHLFSVDVSNYDIKKDEAEKLINTAIKFYFENKDKVFVNVQLDVEISESEKDNNIIILINDFEKGLKLFNYIPKNKVLSFLKSLKENL
jgi:BioD-like phosphotransacetylase family protein